MLTPFPCLPGAAILLRALRRELPGPTSQAESAPSRRKRAGSRSLPPINALINLRERSSRPGKACQSVPSAHVLCTPRAPRRQWLARWGIMNSCARAPPPRAPRAQANPAPRGLQPRSSRCPVCATPPTSPLASPPWSGREGAEGRGTEEERNRTSGKR